jgi:hypothetical protein
MSCEDSNLVVYRGRDQVFDLVATDACTGDPVDLTETEIRAFLASYHNLIELSSEDGDIEVTDSTAGKYSIYVKKDTSGEFDIGDIVSVEVSAEFPTETINNIGRFYFTVKGAQEWQEEE